MAFRQYFKDLGEEGQVKLAERCKVSPGHLKLVAYGYRLAGESLAIDIERETGRAVLCEQLRPDVDWNYIRGTKPAA